MKIVLTLIILLSSFLWASDEKVDEAKKARVEKQIKIEMQREEEYAKSNSFYIDLKGAEVNEESIKDIPILEPQDLDMDSVYD